MNETPSHGDLLVAIEALRKDVAPLVEMQPQLKQMAEVMNALEVGGKGVKWIASIATALLTIGGMMLAIRAMWQSWWGGA
jgi:hypothetical protein